VLSRALLTPLLLLITLPALADHHLCNWVYDGDTIRLAGGERVRLLGVDAPELHHPERGEEPFGREAMELALSLVSGEAVELEYHDGDALAGARRDIYGRVLAYVWVVRLGPDGRQQRICLNLELLRTGLARATRSWEHPRLSQYVEAEQAARAEGVGFWAGSPSRSSTSVLVTRHGARYHRPGCPHVEGRKTRKLDLAAAEKRGFTPCRRCRP